MNIRNSLACQFSFNFKEQVLHTFVEMIYKSMHVLICFIEANVMLSFNILIMLCFFTL